MSVREMSETEKLNIKSALLEHCRAYVQALLDEARRGIKESREAANQEEKSSAGDKFETHRAMMHLQMESFIQRYEVAERLEDQLLSLMVQPVYRVGVGALVETEERVYFIAVSAPPLTLEGASYTCLSIEAPLYQAMRGLGAGDWIEWGGEDEEIEIIDVI